MNRSILYCSVVLFFTLLSGCKETEIVKEEVPEGEYLNIEGQFLNFDEMGAYAFFGIKSNASWTVSSSDSWLTLSSDSGEGDDLIRVTADANQSVDVRTANIRVTSAGGIAKNVFVAQGELDFMAVTPLVSVAGRNIWITGFNLFMIEEVWFFNEEDDILIQGTILEDGRTDIAMRVNVPLELGVGEFEIKVKLLDGNEMIVGEKITLLDPNDIKPVMTLPPPERMVACAGEDVVFPCTFPEEVTEVWFGDVKGVIKSTGNNVITVTIPAGTPQNVCEIKMFYDEGNENETIGKFSIALDAGDYYRWENITFHRQSDNSVEEKAFCLQYGMLVSYCWVQENMSGEIGTGNNQPAGYRYILFRTETHNMRFINPNNGTVINTFTCDGGLTTNGLPTVRWYRIDGTPYMQNQAYPVALGGGTTHNPSATEIALYNAIKNGWLLSAQWDALAVEYGNNPSLAPRQQSVATINGIADYININNGNRSENEMGIIFSTFASSTTYYNSVAEHIESGRLVLQHSGVALWSAVYDNAVTIHTDSHRQLNGAIELVEWVGQNPAGSTGRITINILRKKTWNHSLYRY